MAVEERVSMEVDRNKVQIFPCTIRGAYCDEFNCRQMAEFFVGRPNGPINGHKKLCSRHKEELVDWVLAEHAHKMDKILEMPSVENAGRFSDLLAGIELENIEAAAKDSKIRKSGGK